MHIKKIITANSRLFGKTSDVRYFALKDVSCGSYTRKRIYISGPTNDVENKKSSPFATESSSRWSDLVGLNSINPISGKNQIGNVAVPTVIATSLEASLSDGRLSRCLIPFFQLRNFSFTDSPLIFIFQLPLNPAILRERASEINQ